MAVNKISEADLWEYFTSKTDQELKNKIESWRYSNDYDHELFQRVAHIHNLTEGSIQKIDDVEDAKTEFFRKVSSHKKKPVLRRSFLKYAAALALLITASIYYFVNITDDLIIIQTAHGENKSFVLPDGSKVWLNATSKLTYSSTSPRSLSLEGEAFFEVAKNKDVPFIVSTHDMLNVRALGTSFNVRSYKQTGYTETVLFTGKVEVTGSKFDQKIQMLPNDKLTFLRHEERVINITLNNLDDITSWRNGKIRFHNKNFKDIAIDLNIYFGTTIQFNNEDIMNARFTGSFRNDESVQEILNALSLTSPFKYKRISDNEWQVD